MKLIQRMTSAAVLICVSLCGCAKAPVTSEKSTEVYETTVEQSVEQIMETAGEQCSIYKARVHEILKDQALALFGGDREIVLEQENDSQFYLGKKTYSFRYQDGTSLYIDCGVLVFKTKEYEDYPVQYFLQEDVASEVFPEGVETVCPQKDLWFMTYDDAEQLIAGYLDELGIEYGEEWRCYPVTGAVLTEAVNRHYPQDEYEADVSFGYSPVKRTYDESDDIYLYWIPLAIEGYELSANGIYAANQPYQLSAGWAQAIVGSTGVWYLEVWHPFEETEILDSGNIISEEAAVEIAEEYSSHLLGMGKITLSSQGMYYVPEIKTVMTADAFELYPAWQIEAITENGDETILYVNALTGEIK